MSGKSYQIVAQHFRHLLPKVRSGLFNWSGLAIQEIWIVPVQLAEETCIRTSGNRYNPEIPVGWMNFWYLYAEGSENPCIFLCTWEEQACFKVWGHDLKHLCPYSYPLPSTDCDLFWRTGENVILHMVQFSIACLFHGQHSLMNSLLITPCLAICVHQVTQIASCPYYHCYFFKILIKIPFIFDHQPFLLHSV